MAGQIFSRSRRGNRRERFSVSGERVAELRSVGEPGEDYGASDVDQLRGRFHQSARPGDRGARSEAAEEREIYSDSSERTDARARYAHIRGDLEGSHGRIAAAVGPLIAESR